MRFSKKCREWITENRLSIVPVGEDKIPWEKNYYDDRKTDIDRQKIIDSPMYGIICGFQYDTGKSLIVFDVDIKNGKTGLQDLDNFKTKLNIKNSFENTFCVETPSGGLHYYFYHTGKIQVKNITSDLEVKGDRCLITGFESVRQDGIYKIKNNTKINELPIEIVSFFETFSRVKKSTQTDDNVLSIDDKNTIFENLLKVSNLFTNHTDRICIGKTLYNLGFTLEQWTELCDNNPKCKTDWKGFDKNNSTTLGTILYYFNLEGIKVKLSCDCENKPVIMKNYYYQTPTEDEIVSWIMNGEKKTDKPKNEQIPLTNLQDNLELLEPLKFLSSYENSSEKMNKILFMNDEPENLINSFPKLTSICGKKNIGFDFIRGTLGKPEYMEFLSINSKTYDRFSSTFETEIDSKTFYTNQNIIPEKNGLFRKFLNTLQFTDDKYRYRYCSSLLSSFLPRRFDGKKPFFCILSQGVGSGKTTTANIGSYLITGNNPINLRMDKEDSQQINGVSSFSNKFVLYDNIQKASVEQLRQLSIQITSDKMDSWIFGQSHCQTINNKVILGTINSTENITTDLKDRMLSIWLKTWDNNNKQDKHDREQISKYITDCRENRIEILQDILYGIQNSQNSMNKCKVIKNTRFPEWSEYILPFLQYFFPEVEEFDLSLQDEDEEMNSDVVIWEEFFNDILDNEQTISISGERLREKWIEKHGLGDWYSKSLVLFSRQVSTLSHNLTSYKVSQIRTSKSRFWEITNLKYKTEKQTTPEHKQTIIKPETIIPVLKTLLKPEPIQTPEQKQPKPIVKPVIQTPKEIDDEIDRILKDYI